jgi:hypothetical protein
LFFEGFWLSLVWCAWCGRRFLLVVACFASFLGVGFLGVALFFWYAPLPNAVNQSGRVVSGLGLFCAVNGFWH